MFKSTRSQTLKKWLIKSTVACIENEPKVSSYAGFIEHFDDLLENLEMSDPELMAIYVQLIRYLEKHPV